MLFAGIGGEVEDLIVVVFGSMNALVVAPENAFRFARRIVSRLAWWIRGLSPVIRLAIPGMVQPEDE